MFKLSQEQKRWWEFLWAMTERELKSKYKITVLGLSWVILNPVIQMMVIWFIFKFFTPLKTEGYLLYLFSGLVVWNFFSSSVIRSTPAVVSERFLLKKSSFPKETIVLAIVLSNLLQLFVSLILMFFLLLILKTRVNFLTLILLPLPILFLVLFTLGCCLFFSTVNVRFRDTNFAVNFLVSVWFYITPIIYTVSMLPSSVASWLYVNPMSGLLDFFRWCVFGWSVNNLNLIIIDIVVSLFIFISGLYFFNKKSLTFDDWV